MLKAAALSFTCYASLLALPAHATQEYILPTLFDVTGVAANDVLNIREAPSGKAAIIGSFSPRARYIEVVEEQNGWGRVNSGEQSGWVSMRYLAYHSNVWQENRLPASLSCFGTEPFWSFSVQRGQAVLEGADMTYRQRPVQAVLGGDVFRDPTRAIVADGLEASIVPQICSDGMSDRTFGLTASIILSGGRARLLKGCCSIQP